MLCRVEETDRPLYGEGFEEFVASIYMMAVRLGHPTRESIRASVAGVDPRDVDHAISELLAREFLRVEERGALGVVPPREAVARYAESTEMRLRIARATAPELESAWRKALGRGGSPITSGIDVLTGVEEISSRMSALHLAARERLWWAIDGSPAGRLLLERAVDDPGLLEVRGGVEHRLILDTGLLEMSSAVRVMEDAVERGTAVRMGNGIPISAVVCDDDTAILDISRFDPQGAGSVEVRESGPVLAVASLLERMWRLAAPFGPMRAAAQRKEHGESSAPLDERDQAILGLMSAGASDQAIARNIGVSVRTVERRVRYIMEHLGAATRFHAGAQAVRRGWV